MSTLVCDAVGRSDAGELDDAAPSSVDADCVAVDGVKTVLVDDSTTVLVALDVEEEVDESDAVKTGTGVDDASSEDSGAVVLDSEIVGSFDVVVEVEDPVGLGVLDAAVSEVGVSSAVDVVDGAEVLEEDVVVAKVAGGGDGDEISDPAVVDTAVEDCGVSVGVAEDDVEVPDGVAPMIRADSNASSSSSSEASPSSSSLSLLSSSLSSLSSEVSGSAWRRNFALL